MTNKVTICALASGSNGNCYYIGNETGAILIDAGISARSLQLRLTETELYHTGIKAILITHEHSDHCRSVRSVSKRLGNIPVYLTKDTYLAIPNKDRPSNVAWFDKNTPFSINDFSIFPFSKQHDAADACSFRIVCNEKHIGVMTDIGTVCENVKKHFTQCHAVFLESNYDEDMLWSGSYPTYLKRRVASDYGHLSNNQSSQLAEFFAGRDLEVIFLSHISQENNTLEKAMDAFIKLSLSCLIKPTSRFGPAEVYRL